MKYLRGILLLLKLLLHLLKLLLKGNLKGFYVKIINTTNRAIDKSRLKKNFKPISENLILNQTDYRLLVYKNFNYEYSRFRETFKKYGSSKGGEWRYSAGSCGRNNVIRSFYAEYYEESLKVKQVKNILEIGIAQYGDLPGPSLRSWKELFPQANIFGADINKKSLFEEDRIQTFYTDQLNKKELSNLYNQLKHLKFDFIIDDGKHTYEANINTFEALYPLLTEDGFFFIEDINFRNLNKYYDYLQNNFNFKIIECLNVNGIYDGDGNCLIQIKKA